MGRQHNKHQKIKDNLLRDLTEEFPFCNFRISHYRDHGAFFYVCHMTQSPVKTTTYTKHVLIGMDGLPNNNGNVDFFMLAKMLSGFVALCDVNIIIKQDTNHWQTEKDHPAWTKKYAMELLRSA